MKAKRAKKKIRRIFSVYNFAIFGCIILICASLYMVFKPNITEFAKNIGESISKKQDNREDVKSEEKSKDKTSEKQAKKTAVKQFKELGETTKEDELQIMKIQRKGEEYYYVTSKENTLEIKISTGKVTRINSVIVEE